MFFAAWTATYFQGALPCTHNLPVISLTVHSGDKSSCPSSVKKQHNAGSEEGELDVSIDQTGNTEHILEKIETFSLLWMTQIWNAHSYSVRSSLLRLTTQPVTPQDIPIANAKWGLRFPISLICCDQGAQTSVSSFNTVQFSEPPVRSHANPRLVIQPSPSFGITTHTGVSGVLNRPPFQSFSGWS